MSKNSSEYPVQVGVGRVDITPTENPLPALMGGASPLPAEFVSLPLYVKAMVLIVGEQKVAMVTLDLLKYPSEQTDAAAKQIEQETGIPADHVTITASHTHSGPLYHYYIDPVSGRNRLIESIVEAVKAANNDLSPCKIGITKTQVTGVSHNRRLLKDGEAWNYWLVQPPELRKTLTSTGPIDPELQALAAVREDGTYKAVLWNYALHTNANRVHAISPDFPGHVQQHVNEKLGYETMTIFLPGACADLNPDTDLVTIGQTIADKLIESLNSIRFIDKPTITVEHRILQIPGRENPYFAEEEIATKWPGMLEYYRKAYQETLQSSPETHDTHLTGIRFDAQFAIITSPGEIFAAIGLAIKNNSPFGQTMFAQQTNGAIGYIPGTKDFALKGYEVWYGEHSNLSVNAGETIKNESLDILTNLK